MSDRDSLAERGRSLEESYFRKKNQELIERMRRAAAADELREDLGRRTGLRDPELLDELRDLGFTPETVGLLPLVPVVQMAWAEGGVTRAERELIVSVARTRGIEEGSPADRQLDAWMTERPTDLLFGSATRLVRAVLDTGATEAGALSADDLVRVCEDIARASGGILGIGRISTEERELLAALQAALRTRRT